MYDNAILSVSNVNPSRKQSIAELLSLSYQ